MRALRDMNMPKFVFDDVPLFHGLINDLFPGLKADRVGYEDLKEKIIEEMKRQHYDHNEQHEASNDGRPERDGRERARVPVQRHERCVERAEQRRREAREAEQQQPSQQPHLRE